MPNVWSVAYATDKAGRNGHLSRNIAIASANEDGWALHSARGWGACFQRTQIGSESDMRWPPRRSSAIRGYEPVKHHFASTFAENRASIPRADAMREEEAGIQNSIYKSKVIWRTGRLYIFVPDNAGVIQKRRNIIVFTDI